MNQPDNPEVEAALNIHTPKGWRETRRDLRGMLRELSHYVKEMGDEPPDGLWDEEQMTSRMCAIYTANRLARELRRIAHLSRWGNPFVREIENALERMNEAGTCAISKEGDSSGDGLALYKGRDAAAHVERAAAVMKPPK